jgi:hypothetical protein
MGRKSLQRDTFVLYSNFPYKKNMIGIYLPAFAGLKGREKERES